MIRNTQVELIFALLFQENHLTFVDDIVKG